MDTSSTISIIIPTLNAQHFIGKLLRRLESQTIRPIEIMVVDSSSTDATQHIVNNVAAANSSVHLVTIPRTSFNHGGTRNYAFSYSHGDFVLFLTQDALPSDNHYIEHLIRPFEDPLVGQITGRQLPREDAWQYEKLVRAFNYPSKSNVRNKSCIPRLGIKAFFASDACSAYRRTLFEQVGGFPSPVKTNEDMLIAARLLNAGYKVAYQANATVIHSHNMTLRQQFCRNKLIAEEMSAHKQLLSAVPAGGEGIRMVRFVSSRLLNQGNIISCLRFWLDCGARLTGNMTGKMVYRHRHPHIKQSHN